MKSYIASALLALAVNAGPVENPGSIEVVNVDEVDFTEVTEVTEQPVELLDQKEEAQTEVLIDYVDTEGNDVEDHRIEIEDVHTDKLEIVEDPYEKGTVVSVNGNVCERAIGHDGHYDKETGVWMLEDDLDYEPEWRCLMRPLLHDQVKLVGEAELSIESKGLLEEKQALVRVHERLVKEAEREAKKKNCLEYIERKMSEYQECELKVLRAYVKAENSDPDPVHELALDAENWEDFLVAKKVCVNKFSEEVYECSTLFVWSVDGEEGHPTKERSWGEARINVDETMTGNVQMQEFVMGGKTFK